MRIPGSNLCRTLGAKLPLLFVCYTLSLPATAASLTGASLYSSVEKYSSFGEHRTGTAADHQTSEWLATELEGLGFEVERQRFELKQFFPQVTQLTIGNETIPAFPHWFPQVVDQTIVAPLVELPAEPRSDESLQGRIAYLAPEHADEWHKLDVSALAVRAAAQGAVALVVAVPHPSKAIYARNAAEPYLQTPLPVPTLIVAASAAPLLAQALANKQAVTFELSGLIDEQAYGVNVLARLNRGGDWVVVSTPSSGWFTATGERGGGVALWLGAARWVAQHDETNSYVFVSNSGHELDMTGSKYTLPLMPDPARVRLWLHLGASIGTRQWEETEDGFKPLNEHSSSYLFAYWKILWTAWRSFSHVSEVLFLPSFLLPPDRGELVHFIDAGYPAMGFVADHLFFHTPDDKPGVSSAELLAPYGTGVESLLRSIQP
jgi:hypothetical protein